MRVRPPLPVPALLALGLLGASAPGRAELSVLVRPDVIAAGTFYHGATIHVQGWADEGSQIVVRVTGPRVDELFNRRARIGGLIWGGVEHVTIRNAPTLYDVSTSAALASAASPALRERLELGFDTLGAGIRLERPRPDARLLVEHFVRLKQREGLYRISPGSVVLGDERDGRRRFSVDVPVTSAAPPGDLEVSVFETTRGELAGSRSARVTLAHVGLPLTLHTLAHERSLSYGFLALAVCLATGLLIGLLGRVRGPSRAPIAWDPMVIAGEPRVVAAEPPPERVGRVLRAVADPLLPGISRPASTSEAARMRERYTLFRRLLAINNELLASLSDLEEESSWTSYRHPRVRIGIRALFDGTTELIHVLNELCGDRYFDLANVVTGIRRDVSEYLAKAPESEDPRLVLPLSAITTKTAPMAGGKAANLARLDGDLGLGVPRSVVLTTEAYRLFLESGDLASKLRTVLSPARLDAPKDLEQRCALAQGMIDEATVPAAVARAIESAYDALCEDPLDGVAIRSSATGEDSEVSFAGQFDSVLNVARAGVVEAWRSVVRSRFSPRAFFYRRAWGIAEVDSPMAVLMQRMVRARASGVLFTRRPDDAKANVILLTAVRGLGSEASAGTANVDTFVVSRRAPHAVLERRVARKGVRVASSVGGGVVQEGVTGEASVQPAVADPEIQHLAAQALGVERYFGRPQDIEWAVDETGGVYFLQARPLRTERPDRESREEPRGAVVRLRGGDEVWPGRAVGPVHVTRTREDEELLPAGSILVAPRLLADCVRLLPRVCGVIVERGSVLGHAASILREFRVPSLFGVEGALAALKPGDVVSLDAAAHRVYDGALWPELRGSQPVTLLGRRSLGLPPVLSGKLTKLSGSTFIGSWACQSLHDVIRFAHEAAIQAMFEIGDSLRSAKVGGVVRLDAPPNVFLHLIDLGGGIRPGTAVTRKGVKPEDVVCVPFQGLWRGLGDEGLESVRLGAPVLGGFASVMLSTMREDATRSLGQPNYACVTDCYLNLNSRQAYHFAIVDAFLSENQNANHVSVRLRGGGAAPWQRTLRGEFMAQVLRIRGFTAQVRSDLLNAMLRGVDVESGQEALRTVGHLLRFAAQLDMWMTSESRVSTYVDAFLQAEERALAASSPTRS